MVLMNSRLHRKSLIWKKSGTYLFGHEQSPFAHEHDLFAHPMQLSQTKKWIQIPKKGIDAAFSLYLTHLRFRTSELEDRLESQHLVITCFETASFETWTSILSSIAGRWAAYGIAFVALWNCTIITKFHFGYFSLSTFRFLMKIVEIGSIIKNTGTWELTIFMMAVRCGWTMAKPCRQKLNETWLRYFKTRAESMLNIIVNIFKVMLPQARVT